HRPDLGSTPRLPPHYSSLRLTFDRPYLCPTPRFDRLCHAAICRPRRTAACRVRRPAARRPAGDRAHLPPRIAAGRGSRAAGEAGGCRLRPPLADRAPPPAWAPTRGVSHLLRYARPGL